MSPIKRDLLPKDIASALNVSTDTIGRYARAGLIPFDKTPKGHRRFNLAEVQQALVDMDSDSLDFLRSPGGVPRNPLALGPVVVMSKSARLRENLRATRTAPSFSSGAENVEDSDPSSGTFEDLLKHSRRVLISH